MQTFHFWQRWLFVVSLVILVFGLLLALFNQSLPFDLLLNNQVDPVFWGGSEVPPAVAAFQPWVYGVLGATMAGWGVFLAFIVHYPFGNREPWSWTCILSGLVLWYVADTGLSLYYGVIFNALFNTAFFLAGVLPLFFTRKEFSR